MAGLLLAGLLLAGCGGNGAEPVGTGSGSGANDANNGTNDIEETDKFVFVTQGVRVALRQPAADLLAVLTPQSYHVAASCLIDGFARIYIFDGFEVEAFPFPGSDEYRIMVIKLSTAATVRGVSVGDTYADMVAAYGADYDTFPGGAFEFSQDGNVLSFNLWDGVIESIMYFVDDFNE